MGVALETRPRCVDDSKQMKREREMRMSESWGMITIFQATLRVWDRNKGSGEVNGYDRYQEWESTGPSNC